MRVLVTGSEGFIGSHLVEALLSDGHEVVAFVQYNSEGTVGWLRDIQPRKITPQIVFGDVRDPLTVNHALEGVDAIAHLAALISVPYSFRAPSSFVDTNVSGTLNVLEAAHAHGIRRTLVMSTSEVYGSAQTLPMAESHPLRAQSPYAASKIGADMLATSFAHSRDMDVVIARPFNTYGPRQSTRAVVSTVLRQILDGRRVLKLGAISPRRDLVYVADTARAICGLLNSTQAFRGEAFNIATGVSYSVSEVVSAASLVSGYDLLIESDATRLRPVRAEVDHLLGDASRLAQLTGWQPAISLEVGLKLTLDWWESGGTFEHPSV